MVKKKKKVEKRKTEESNIAIEEKIQELVDKNGEKLTDEEKKMQVDAFKKIFIEGKTPLESMELPEEFPKYLYKTAYDQYNLGLYEEANQIFRILCMLEPLSAKYQMGLAATNHQMGNYELASSLYFTAWYCDTQSPIPFFYISDCALNLGNYDAAYFMLSLAAELCGMRQEYSQLKTRCYQTMKGLREQYGIRKEEDEEKGEDETNIINQLRTQAEEKAEGVD